MKLSSGNIDTETELFRLLQNGDEKAFTLIYQNHHKALYGLAYRYLKSRHLTEDALQHVFSKLWEQRKELSIAVSLKNYLYTMMHNYILNQIRNNNNEIIKNYGLAQSQPYYEDNLLEVIEKKDLTDLLQKAVEQLPLQKKKVWMLKIDEEYSNKEVAEKLNISVNTVKTHYADALKILRANMIGMLKIVIILIILLS